MMFVCKFDCFAQRPIYHSSGDTIDNMDTIYWIPEWYRSCRASVSKELRYTTCKAKRCSTVAMSLVCPSLPMSRT